MLNGLLTRIWDQEHIPLEWKEGILVKLPKKGDLSLCKNYRGIMLLSTAVKVLNRIILERMREAVDRVRTEGEPSRLQTIKVNNRSNNYPAHNRGAVA